MTLYKIDFRGLEAWVTNERIKLLDKANNCELYYYDLTSSNVFNGPQTIEKKKVIRKYWGTIVFRQSIDNLFHKEYKNLSLLPSETKSIAAALHKENIGIGLYGIEKNI